MLAVIPLAALLYVAVLVARRRADRGPGESTSSGEQLSIWDDVGEVMEELPLLLKFVVYPTVVVIAFPFLWVLGVLVNISGPDPSSAGCACCRYWNDINADPFNEYGGLLDGGEYGINSRRGCTCGHGACRGYQAALYR